MSMRWIMKMASMLSRIHDGRTILRLDGATHGDRVKIVCSGACGRGWVGTRKVQGWGNF